MGVHAPEAYTLPTAVVLVLVGFHRLQPGPGRPTMTALLPGLVLATVPSLLWVLVDPVSTRAALLGLACLVLLLGGAALRWTAPVVVGGLVGGVLVLRELAPYAAETPQWVLIGAAGTLLHRRRDHLGGAAARPAAGGGLPRPAALTPGADKTAQVLPTVRGRRAPAPGAAGGAGRRAVRAPYVAI